MYSITVLLASLITPPPNPPVQFYLTEGVSACTCILAWLLNDHQILSMQQTQAMKGLRYDWRTLAFFLFSFRTRALLAWILQYCKRIATGLLTITGGMGIFIYFILSNIGIWLGCFYELFIFKAAVLSSNWMSSKHCRAKQCIWFLLLFSTFIETTYRDIYKHWMFINILKLTARLIPSSSPGARTQ